MWDSDYLDMRYDNSENPLNPATAADILNTTGPYELVNIFEWFGEERYSWNIAAEIIKYR